MPSPGPRALASLSALQALNSDSTAPTESGACRKPDTSALYAVNFGSRGSSLIRLFASRAGRLLVGIWFVILVTSLSGSNLIPVASVQQASCTVSPNPAALDQLFTVSATGLPSTVNLIITFPNKTAATSPISVSSNGTYTLTMSSAGSMFPSEQTGTYTYQFVGRIKWPAGTFRQTYATCSANVT